MSASTKWLRLWLVAGASVTALMAAPAAAQDDDPVESRFLLELMVEKGVVTQAEADALIAKARAKRQAMPQGGVTGNRQIVPHVPRTVREQIKEELRAELANQANAEGWAKPGEVAPWTKSITFSGDVRVRGESIQFADGNSDLSVIDFQSINSGGGYDVSQQSSGSAATNPPLLNTTRNRTRGRIRARLGFAAQIDEWVSAEVRIATGSDTSPVSTNQTLGGNDEFGKYAIWLDRAALHLTPMDGLEIDLGRFANPYWTTPLLFDDDLNFDGIAIAFAPDLGSVKPFVTVGAYPLFNTSLNFGSNEVGAYSSDDKYLLAGQIGAEYDAGDVGVKLAAGYFDFQRVEGRLSSPCNFNQDACDTDLSRPQFVQTGNTMTPIRAIIPDPTDPTGGPEVQYFGLASKFEVLNIHGQIDYKGFDAFNIRLEGDFVHNFGFDRARLEALATNNLGPGVLVPDETTPDPNDTVLLPGAFDGGADGWYANLIVGKPDLVQAGDWNGMIGYRYLASDATLDAFTDSDFHLGGTNAKGFTLGAGYALARNTVLSARWFAAEEVTSVPFSVDVLFVDVMARF